MRSCAATVFAGPRPRDGRFGRSGGWLGLESAPGPHARPRRRLEFASLGPGLELLGVGASIKNAGVRRAGRSLMRFYLSSDRRWSRGDPRLGARRVGALPRRKVSRGIARLIVPPRTVGSAIPRQAGADRVRDDAVVSTS
jgi:hypothetical protein